MDGMKQQGALVGDKPAETRGLRKLAFETVRHRVSWCFMLARVCENSLLSIL